MRFGRIVAYGWGAGSGGRGRGGRPGRAGGAGSTRPGSSSRCRPACCSSRRAAAAPRASPRRCSSSRCSPCSARARRTTSGNWAPAVKARLQRLDHAMIFVLIAGSYTPITLLALEPAWGITFLVLAWTIAVGGAILALWHIDTIHRFAVVHLHRLRLAARARAAGRAARADDDGARAPARRRGALHGRRDRAVAAPPGSRTRDLRVPRGLARDDARRRGLPLRAGAAARRARAYGRADGYDNAGPARRRERPCRRSRSGGSSTTSASPTATASAGSSSPRCSSSASPAVIGTAVEDRVSDRERAYPLLFIFALAGTTMSQVGTTFYAGLLDKVVGEFELGEEPEPDHARAAHPAVRQPDRRRHPDHGARRSSAPCSSSSRA